MEKRAKDSGEERRRERIRERPMVSPGRSTDQMIGINSLEKA